MIIVYKVKADGTFNYSDSVTCDPNRIPEGYAEDLTTDHVKEDGTRPTDAELLEQAKAEKIGEISKACRDSIVNGYAVAINSTDTYTYESELHDQRNLALKGLKVMMDTNITSVDHKTIEVGTVTHTRDEFLLVVSEADTHIDKNVDKYRSLKQQVKDATTITDVDNITW